MCDIHMCGSHICVPPIIVTNNCMLGRVSWVDVGRWVRWRWVKRGAVNVEILSIYPPYDTQEQ